MGAVATPARSGIVRSPTTGDCGRARLFEPVASREPSLEDAIRRVWDELTETGAAECPVCAGAMRVDDGCAGCGSQLE